MENSMSKGSKPRPIPNPDQYRENFDRIFRKTTKKPGNK